LREIQASTFTRQKYQLIRMTQEADFATLLLTEFRFERLSDSRVPKDQLWMNSKKQITPDLHLLASATSLETLEGLLAEQTPDVILIYLAREIESGYGELAYEKIDQLKSNWSDIPCIVIVKYASQIEMAKETGADIALIEGVNAERLLAAIEGKTSA
jgi:CheY-like chemotaxis protein